MEPVVNQETGKTAGIVCYFTFIGWLVAYFGMHQNNKTEQGSYQLRQTLLLYIVSFVLWIVLDMILLSVLLATGLFFIAWVPTLIWIGLFILWLIGLIGAINGEQKPIPIIGPMAQNMFKGI